MIRQLRPHYRGADGQLVIDPLLAADTPPIVDLDGLARLFTGPGLFGEFAPSSYFRGAVPVWPPVTPVASAEPWARVFAAAVEELCADADTVGVALSGGLDSLAVLVHVLALRPRRRVVAFVVDLLDDDGELTASVVRRLLTDLAIDEQVEVVVVDLGDDMPLPLWSPYGPRPEALPKATARIAALAHEAGVDVLLSGDGADELLAVPRYATRQVLQRTDVRAAIRYLTDVARSGPGIAGELLAAVSRVLPPLIRTRLYWAATWPDWAPPTVSPVLAAPYRKPALAWAQCWVREAVQGHVTARRSWATADAFDAWWPRNYRPPAGAVPEASPFLHPDVVATALALPIASHYDAAYDSPYLRAKALVVDLFPYPMRQVLPRRKRTYRAALATAVADVCEAPCAVEVGLLDVQALAEEQDTATRMMVAAVEQWLVGAHAAGITVSA